MRSGRGKAGREPPSLAFSRASQAGGAGRGCFGCAPLEAVGRGSRRGRQTEAGHPVCWSGMRIWLSLVGPELEVGVESGGKTEESWESLNKSGLFGPIALEVAVCLPGWLLQRL